MKRWVEPAEIEVSPAVSAAVGGHPLVAETLARRGYTSPDAALGFLDPAHYSPASPYDLPDMARAVDRLQQALAADEQICVWGDFDVDGQTATALLVSALEALGADVGYHVPVRESEGHGVNLTGLELVIEDGARVVLTCDTGITAHEAVAHAQARGVDFVITDHHEPAAALPEAVAVVNPRRLPAGHPLSHLPGVGVAYKLAEALYTAAGREAEAARLLDLVALGIVADVATQVADTRYLLQRGLAALRRPERLGLRVMMELAGLDPEGLTEAHIGFILGPRLNAAGRLADARAGVELLTTSDLSRARILASHMETLNAQRRRMCDEVFVAAEAQIAQDPCLLDDAALVLAHPTWPAGVIGIVASRLVEAHGRPVVLLSSPPGEPARGSARSVDGVNITQAIAAQAELLAGFGGHPMAAGLSLLAENIPAFRRGLARTVAAMTGGIPAQPSLEIDAYATLDALTIELAAELERLAPFGPGNPPVTLAARGLILIGSRPVGREGEHLVAEIADTEGTTRRAIRWEGAGETPAAGVFDLAFVLRARDFRGESQVEIEWVSTRQEAAAAEASAVASYEVTDHRTAQDGEAELRRLLGEGPLSIWREGDAAASLPGADRYGLEPDGTLAIWTTPPGPAELRAVLARAQPERVHLFAVDPSSGSPDAFVRRLAGLTKYALSRHSGETSIPALAAAMAGTEAAVRLGLTWLTAHGDLRVIESEAGGIRLEAGTGTQERAADALMDRLGALLAESAAYRQHFRKAPAERVLPPRNPRRDI